MRGDVRAGPRGDVAVDQGVFNIMVGTAITVAIADGSKAPGTLADVTYLDCWEEKLFARRAKLDWLVGGSEHGELPNFVTVDRPELDDFRPTPFQNGEWLSLREAFLFSKSGMKSGNDPIFVKIEHAHLQAGILPLIASRDDPTYNAELETRLAYRPFDNRWFFNDPVLLNRRGPDMQRAWGEQNFGLYSLKSNTGAGPGVWCHGLIPDYHAIKGSNGGYAFPLYDRRVGPDATNVAFILIASLGEAYGLPIAPEDIFDAILCLLSAKSYTRRFAEDLEDVFPHIPLPATHETFRRAAEIGREIRGLEAFVREPHPTFRPKGFCKIASEPDGVVAVVIYSDGEIKLCENGTGRITGIPEAVWGFTVSGYRVLPQWIDSRRTLPATLAFIRELRDVAARIAELIHWFDAADLVLDETLGDTLTRAELGFPAPEPEEADEGDD